MFAAHSVIAWAMARPLRIEYDGALYHLTSRGNERKAIFRDNSDREMFLTTLEQVCNRFHWLCHAYCLMNNHYHLVIETPDGNLSKGMRQLNGVYTQAFNRRHRRVGHLFQGRFKGILVQKESHFLEVCRYVVLNPVRAKAVKHPRDWLWSSYNPTAGLVSIPSYLTVEEILGQFGQRRGPAQQKYRDFVHDGVGRATIWDQLEAQSLLGVEGFAEALRGHVTGQQTEPEIPKGQRMIGRPSLKKLLDAARQNKAKRNRLIAEAVSEHGYSQVEVAKRLKLHYSTISRLIKSVTD
jgi:REP element-mobilizing transposase RayT